MTAYVALLRAVNVGGANRVPMAELRAALVARGFEGVSTILASGNVLFRSDEPEHTLAVQVGDVIEERFGVHSNAVVRSGAELAAIVGRNPFLVEAGDRAPSTLHVTFLSKFPSAAALSTLEPDRSPPDTFAIAGREIFLSYPNGSASSRLTLDYFERRLHVDGTARNWRTVTRLAALLAP